MFDYKRFAAIAVMILVLALAGCSGTSGQTESTAAASGESIATENAAESTNWNETTATKVTLDGDSIAVDGAGATANGGTLTISASGTYLLSGTLNAGQIRVEAPKDTTVHLVLNGVEIAAAENAAIYNQSAGTLIITLADGTTNTVSDAVDFIYANTTDEEPDAAIFSKNNLTIEGSGALTVSAGYNNGIGAKDDLLVTGGTLNITAANHGLRGRDSVTVQGGDLTIDAGNDGIQSNNDSSADVGWIKLEGGTYHITSAHDGIQAESSLTITGGEYAITSGGGANAQVPAVEEGVSDSYKGLKAVTAVSLANASFDINSLDDAVHSNGDIRIDSGTFAIATGDDAVHADRDLTINDGTIGISASYEGLEAFTMTIAGGTIDLIASDDGINVAGGSDGESAGQGRFGADQFALNGDRWLKITGGHITVDAGGDGIDINGNGEMTGGEVYIHGTTGGGDSALDYDGTFVMNGGVLAGAGSSGMAQAPGSDSTQPSLILYYTGQQTAGTAFALTDSGGNTVLEFTPKKDYQCVVVSAPQLQDGQSYSVLSSGEKLLDITISGTVTSISDTGEAVTGGMRGGPGGGGPGGGRGGMRGGGDPPEGFTPGQRPEGMPPGEPPEGAPGQPGGDASQESLAVSGTAQ